MAKTDYIELDCGGEPQRIPILHEDRSVLAIDKPAGWMLVPRHWQKTEWNLQAAIKSSIAGRDFWARSRNLKFLRYVHRLDADTSGVLLLAKSPGAVDAYGDLFESRKVEKVYLVQIVTVKPQEIPKTETGPTKPPEVQNRQVGIGIGAIFIAAILVALFGALNGDRDASQVCAGRERIVRDAGDTVGDRNAGQPSAGRERRASDVGDAVGDCVASGFAPRTSNERALALVEQDPIHTAIKVNHPATCCWSPIVEQ